MAVGLEVANDSGYIQITSKNKNILLSKWSRVNTAGKNVFKPSTMVVAIKPDAGQTMAKPSQSAFIDSGVVGKGVVYEFDWGVDDGDRVGLQIFNADGTVAYKSSKNALRVLDSGSVKIYENWTRQYNKPVAIVFNQTVSALSSTASDTVSVLESSVSMSKVGASSYRVTVNTGVVASFYNPNPTRNIATDTAYFLVIDASTLPDSSS